MSSAYRKALEVQKEKDRANIEARNKADRANSTIRGIIRMNAINAIHDRMSTYDMQDRFSDDPEWAHIDVSQFERHVIPPRSDRPNDGSPQPASKRDEIEIMEIIPGAYLVVDRKKVLDESKRQLDESLKEQHTDG